ncbi:MAG: DUF58 domain-containing protein [Ruminococcaceae bacterium]|nr:DUF58 domain-containing protein [Oscillospiraceae bacterium]
MKLRRVLVLCFFLLALFLASIRSGRLVYTLLFISVLMPLLSSLYTLYVYYRLRVMQRLDSRYAIKNEPVKYICRISNEMRFSAVPRLELSFHSDLSEVKDIKDPMALSFDPNTSREVSTTLVCKRRGEYVVGVKKLMISDVLGIIRPAFDPPVELRVTVYPRILHPDSMGIFSFEGSKPRNMISSFDAVPGDTVHEYVVGDDPRLIHWKASARTGQLQVRQLTGIERPSLVIVADTRRFCAEEAAIAREDNLLETMLAMSAYCLEHNIDVDVYTAYSRFIIRSQGDFNELYEWTCHMTFEEGGAAAVIPEMHYSCCALLICGEDDNAAAMLTDAAESGAECVLMEFGGEHSDRPENHAAGFTFISVPDDCDITDILC